MTSISGESNGRRPVSPGFERDYWRCRLLRNMEPSPTFRNALNRLRSAIEQDRPIVQKMREQDLLIFGDLGGVRAFVGDGEIDVLSIWEEVYKIRQGYETGSERLTYPQALFGMLHDFRLVHDRIPAQWAVRLVDSIVRYDITAIHPHLTILWTFDKNIRIHLSIEGGHVSLWRKAGSDREETLGSWLVSPPSGAETRFGSNEDWKDLKEMAIEAASQAVDSIREEFQGRYPTVRDASAYRRWEGICNRLALQLTGRSHSSISNDQRRRFCERIQMDNPVTQSKRE